MRFMNTIKKKRPPSAKVESVNLYETKMIKILAIARRDMEMRERSIMKKDPATKTMRHAETNNLKRNCKIL